VFANYYFIVEIKLGYLGLFAGQFISGLFSFIVYLFIVYGNLNLKPDYSFSLSWVKKKLKIAIPTIPHYYAGYIINISDRVLLDWFNVPIQQIGLYSFAYSFGTYFSIIGKSFMQAAGPYYLENLKKENKDGEKSNSNISKYMQIGLLGSAFLLSIWLKEIFSLLVKNEELAGAYIFTTVIIFSFTYFPSYAQVSMKLWYSEKTKLLMKITVSAAAVSIAVNLVLIPLIGIWGSVIATFLSMMLIGYGGYLVPEIKMNISNYRWDLMLILTIFTLIISFILVESSFYLKASTTIGFALWLIYLLKLRK
jgi:O-antigen/teichoic acid export membrane protein